MDDDAQKEIAIANSEAGKLSTAVSDIKIRKAADLDKAATVLADIKRTYKGIEARRKSITGPINSALKEINNMFKEPLSKLAVAEDLIKTEMQIYQTRVDKRIQKKMDQVQEQVDAGDLSVADGMAKIAGITQGPQSVDTESGQVQFRTVRRLVITDPTALPKSYLMRERVMEALRLEVDADVKDGKPVPTGADYVEQKQTAVRTK